MTDFTKLEKPPELAIDAPIWVKGCPPSCSDSDSCKWKPANFKRFEHYDTEIMATVFADGKNSHTTDSTETYEFWSSTKPEEK